jgi:hypothetical protein
MWKHRDFLVKALISSYLISISDRFVYCKYISPDAYGQECLDTIFVVFRIL